MHSLAMVMHDMGHKVTGSDDEIYEPSLSRLGALGLLPEEMGWHAERIQKDMDVVVLGMHARVDNPELVKAQELGLRIESFPEFVYNVSKGKTRIVVAGSHGKTTTSGMIAHVLDKCGIKADRMIGAKIGALEPVAITDAPVIILEGDEYLTSPLDPRPKFFHYHPQITIITGIAWDHMNVFPTYASYLDQFRQLIVSLGSTELLIYCAEDPDLVELVEDVEPVCKCIPYHSHPYSLSDGMVIIEEDNGLSYPLEIFGNHNLQNLKAAQMATHAIGLSSTDFYKAIQSFTGASKRLQLLHKGEHVTAYLDFAHAPSKVKATVNAVREKHHNNYVIACLELHTFSSLNPEFLPQYKGALSEADVKIVYYSPHTLTIKKLPDLSAYQLAEYFDDPDLIVVTSGDALKAGVQAARKDVDTVLLWMSSGRFDGVDIFDISSKFL
jgi:UDP-N-acetylmuramate: L-alanyl-gamma-D-glutamyl-meso-diaminopimelate ligase